jgi:hypothetical protein
MKLRKVFLPTTACFGPVGAGILKEHRAAGTRCGDCSEVVQNTKISSSCSAGGKIPLYVVNLKF